MKYLILLCLALCGCTTTKYRDPRTGAEFSRTSVFTAQTISEISVTADSLTVKGYSNSQTEVAAAVVGAAISAAKR